VKVLGPLLLDLIDRPTAAFAHIVEKPGRLWLLPLVLGVFGMLVREVIAAPLQATIAAPLQAATAATAGQGMQQRLAQTPTAQAQQAAQAAASLSPELTVVIGLVVGIIGLLLGWLAWSGALYLLGTTVLGAKREKALFAALFTVVAWAWLPNFLRDLVQALFIGVNQRLITYPGLSFLAASGQSIGNSTNPAFVFLSDLDLFFVWNIVLLVLGVAVIMHSSWRKAIGPVLAIWLVFALLSLIPTVITGTGTAGTGMRTDLLRMMRLR
jgi:hypothetical protein